ncbi:MAG: hypothetical protein MMC23_004244 [Stictis urceolatum]|nr:hypothetical protein [Stictis urceolata]
MGQDFDSRSVQVVIKPTRLRFLVTFHTSTLDGSEPQDGVDATAPDSPVNSFLVNPGPQLDATPLPPLDPNLERPHSSYMTESRRLPPLSASFSAPSPETPRSNPDSGNPFYDSPHAIELHSIHSQSPTMRILLPPDDPHHPSRHYQAHNHPYQDSPSTISLSSTTPRVSALYQPSSLWPSLTPSESYLLRHYVDHLSAWIDATDSQQHFGTEVVRRSAHYPVLLYAILAYSALHLSRMRNSSDLAANEYHHRCLKIMIATLDSKTEALDENLLAAIVILRGYEEISEGSPRTHMQGSTRLLNSSAKFASSGGLGEAASWITLRQEIYISLTNNQPIKTRLEPYVRSRAMMGLDHDAWANRIVLIFARILSVIFREGEKARREAEWRSMKEEVETWWREKPGSFEAIVLPREEGSDGESVFPNVWMLDSAQVVGMQNYYMARIVLATFDPRLPGTGFSSFRARKDTEASFLDVEVGRELTRAACHLGGS